MKRSWTTFRRWLHLCGAAVVPLAGLAELGAHLHCAHRAPALDRWSVIAQPVEQLRQPGDLVVVAPGWAEPMARQALDAEVMPLTGLARADSSRFATALEVSILGQRHPDLLAWRELERRQVGKFELRRLENPAHQPWRFDFVTELGPERVDVQSGPSGATCPFRTHGPMSAGGLGGHPTFPAERFQCPGARFFNVSVTVIADQDFSPRRCVWAHPPRQGALRIRYADVTLGDVIAGHGGMYWIIERERKGAPVELSVVVDGTPVGRTVHHDGDGWAGFEFALGEHAGADRAEVEFVVSSANYRHRHYCFEAHSR